MFLYVWRKGGKKRTAQVIIHEKENDLRVIFYSYLDLLLMKVAVENMYVTFYLREKGSKPECPGNRSKQTLALLSHISQRNERNLRFVKLTRCYASRKECCCILCICWHCVGSITVCACYVGPEHLATSTEQWEHHRHLSAEQRGLREQTETMLGEISRRFCFFFHSKKMAC